MGNKSDDHLLVIQATIDANRQNSEYKMKNLTEDLTEMIASRMYQIKMSKYSIDKNNPKNLQYAINVVLDNKKASPFEGGNSTKNGGIWTLKHDITKII